MNSNLLFDFTVDKDSKSIHVKREFAAKLASVWAAWTEPEILDQWWAPKPYRTETKSMDFREGGSWFYAMVAPDNQKHWCRVDYKKIQPLESYAGYDAFCDEEENINPSFPRSNWNISFEFTGSTTIVNITVRYDDLADLEKIIAMGFKEGFTMGLANLDQYIEAQFKLRNQLRIDHSPRVNTYLNFPGNTEEAFLFYQSVFKSAFSGNGIQRFSELPPDPHQPVIADAVKKMVLHVELPITGNHVLMGTDAPKELGFNVVPGNNMFISVEPETKEETRRIFEELSIDGTISMPLQDMFWGAYFGSFTDKFGINWMLNYKL